MSKPDTQTLRPQRLTLKDLAEASAQAVARAQKARCSAMVELTEEEAKAVSGASPLGPALVCPTPILILRPPIVAGGIPVAGGLPQLY